MLGTYSWLADGLPPTSIRAASPNPLTVLAELLLGRLLSPGIGVVAWAAVPAATDLLNVLAEYQRYGLPRFFGGLPEKTSEKAAELVSFWIYFVCWC